MFIIVKLNCKREENSFKFLKLICIVSFFVFSAVFAKAQGNKTFDCNLLSFEYPSNFVSSPILNAPHMILKVQSEDYIFSISYWETEYSDSITAWNDNIYQEYQSFPVESGELISVNKEMIKAKSGDVKCLKIKCNLRASTQGENLRLRTISYIVINNGYKMLFNFASQGEYQKNSPTFLPDKMMKSLSLKKTPKKKQ